MTEQKRYTGQIELKAGGEPGEFRAEFATLGVIDHDGDVTEAGAFTDGQETLIEAWNHNYGELPVGKGIIHEVDDKAVVEGMFFVNTQIGREHYETVKSVGPLQEWSYTFQILDSAAGQFEGEDVRFLRKLDVWGVAPVTRGAGIGTRTRTIKSGGGTTGDQEGEPEPDKDGDVTSDGKLSLDPTVLELEVLALGSTHSAG
jgi:hypothetical protein